MTPQFRLIILNYPGEGCVSKEVTTGEFKLLHDFDTPELTTPNGVFKITEKYFLTDRSPFEVVFIAIIKLS